MSHVIGLAGFRAGVTDEYLVAETAKIPQIMGWRRLWTSGQAGDQQVAVGEASGEGMRWAVGGEHTGPVTTLCGDTVRCAGESGRRWLSNQDEACGRHHIPQGVDQWQGEDKVPEGTTPDEADAAAVSHTRHVSCQGHQIPVFSLASNGLEFLSHQH